MKNIFIILILAGLLASCSKNTIFVGTWFNNSNYCDSLSISESGNKLVVEYLGSKLSSEVNDEQLEIQHGKEKIIASLEKQDELLINGVTYSKKTNDGNLSLNGDWKIYECDEKYEWSNISIKDDTIRIVYGSPVEIIGTLNKNSNGLIEVKYEYGVGTISMSQIIDEFRDKIDYEKPIAYISQESKNHFVMEWKGVTIKNQKEKWLESLGDSLYWGEKANDAGYKITFIKE